jgi:IclR family transcriptional regulator, acetate operon repressor
MTVEQDQPAVTERNEGGQRRTLATAVHVMQVLEAVAADPRGVPAKALARRLGTSLSSTYHMLQSLTALELVETSPVSKSLYTLGPKIAELFGGYMASWRVPQRLEPALLELRDRASARAYAATWSDTDMEVTCTRGRRGATELHEVSAGFRGAAHALAIGKVLLSATPPQRWPAYLRTRQLPRYTPRTLDTPERLYRELITVRRLGYATDVEEYAANVCCVAAPIRDGMGAVLGSIGVSVTLRRYQRSHDELRATVCEVAESLSSSLFRAVHPEAWVGSRGRRA